MKNKYQLCYKKVLYVDNCITDGVWKLPVNTLHAAITSLHYPYKIVFVSQNSQTFTNFSTNTRHVCTYLNAFLMVIPSIVTKFQTFDIFEHFVTFCIVVCSECWYFLKIVWHFHLSSAVMPAARGKVLRLSVLPCIQTRENLSSFVMCERAKGPTWSFGLLICLLFVIKYWWSENYILRLKVGLSICWQHVSSAKCEIAKIGILR